ncbi:hypothetical protein [Candidatus Vampirococcus lugosii]|uniref:Uncharacterized protein n=1 Tax=Candidatus Vampirococcus lugosii TaxID=2789015 RepID=A0ABS5QKI1_9BACT|nr:hypothetical protein [Candidatus Vampirococcus lugosii]MBS8121736.1 hypothetical protein [Candidatus Vampirococcus lugosii]
MENMTERFDCTKNGESELIKSTKNNILKLFNSDLEAIRYIDEELQILYDEVYLRVSRGMGNLHEEEKERVEKVNKEVNKLRKVKAEIMKNN